MRWNGIAASMAAVLLGATLATGAMAQDKAPVSGGTLNVGFISDTKTLDPMVSAQWTERQILFLIFDSLVNLGPDFSLKPGLAKSWDFDDGGKTIVLHLVTGVKFQDGTPFDAAAVKWNIDKRLDPATNSSQRAQLAAVIKDVRVVDDATIAIDLNKPYPPLLAQFADRAGLMVSPTASKKYGADSGSHPVGTGPFELVSWVRGTKITLKRNPDFWQKGKPYLDGVTFNDIPTSVVGVQRMGIGELDYIGQLSPLDTKLAAALPDIKLVPAPVGEWFALQWHWNEKPFNNPMLREAIAHAINRDRMNQILWEGKGKITDSITPPGLWWSPSKVEHYAYDPDLSRKLLKEGGIAPGTKLSLVAPSDDTLRRFAELVQSDLKAVGLDVQLQPVPQSQYYAKAVAHEINFTPMRWTQRADPDGLIQYLFASNGDANTTGYSNPEVDKLIQEARTTTDIADRKKLYDQIQFLVSQGLPYVSIEFSAEFSALRSSVHGFVPMPDLIPRYRDMWKSAN